MLKKILLIAGNLTIANAPSTEYKIENKLKQKLEWKIKRNKNRLANRNEQRRRRSKIRFVDEP